MPSSNAASVRATSSGVATNKAWLAVAAIFVLHALLFASWTAHIPHVKDALGLTNASLGTALLGAPLGSVTAMVLSKWLLPRWGSRVLIQVCVVGYAVAGVAVGQAHSTWVLFAALAGWGLFQGGLDVAMNTQAVSIEKLRGRPIMSGLHGMWSLGAFAGALVGVGAVSAGIALTPQLIALGALALCASAVLTPQLISDRTTTAPPDTLPGPLDTQLGPSSHRARSSMTAVLVLGGIAFASMLCEGAAADWSANYLRSELAAPDGVAGLAYAAYALAMVIARLSGSALQRRFADRRLLPALAVAGCVGIGAVLLSGNVAVAIAGFAALGIGVALVVPTAFSAAGALTDGASNAGSAIATVAALGWIGYVTGPPLIGHLAQLLGLRAALAVVPILLVCIAAAITFSGYFNRRPASIARPCAAPAGSPQQ